jgi:NhaP-type Na+/H+ or K+/H+ antiporter
VSAGLIYALIPGLNFLSSLAVAACLTPTDPILAAAVIGGKYADKHVPAHIRHLLAAEVRCSQYLYVNNMLKVLSRHFFWKTVGL